MALITETPDDLPEASPELDPQYDEKPPAFLSFGRSRAELEDPPERGEIRTYIVRVRCKGIHENERLDGEIRHSRSLQIISCWEEGKPKPPDADNEQPGLFDHGDDDETSQDGEE